LLNWLAVVFASALLLSAALADTAAAAPTATHSVSATQNLTFSPKSLTIHVGDTVTWTNTATGIKHSVTSNTNAWPSTILPSHGSTFSFTFTKAGTFQYHCIFHVRQGMKGTIIVQ
jgi:plastocyanin